ncbi:MAG: GspH/FimT family pseudopilin [Thiogranum sp.]|jgi:type IV fimbrial biogenesis protein FimT|nr:GspH/FimT family pseudopilin [Thiogranum sp.]
MNRENGFTLVELIVTLAIAAILMTVAVPSFMTTIKNNRLITDANRLVSSVGLARSEAIKQGRTATVCVSADQATCTGETDWTLGWMVWVDVNGNAAFDAGEERGFAAAFPGNGVTFTSGASQIQFTPQGAATAAATLDLCDDRAGETGRRINVSNTGRASTTNLGCA